MQGTNPAVLNDAADTYVTGVAMQQMLQKHLVTLQTTLSQKWHSQSRSRLLLQVKSTKAEYTMELAQDLKAIHGLDAETELANILSSEILAEINREVVRTIYVTSKKGAVDTANAGIFDMDVDSNARWSVEKFKGLMFQVERDANAIAQETRRGKGNMIICSSDVASALQMARCS